LEGVAADIKRAVDIVDLVGGYLHLTPAGPMWKGLCPFHDDHAPSLNVDPRWQTYRCWACGAKGDVFTFLQQFEKITFPEALEKLAERTGVELRKGDGRKRERTRTLYDVVAWAEREFQTLLADPVGGREALDYLRERGLTESTIHAYGLGFTADTWEWLTSKGRKKGFSDEQLLAAGLVKVGERGTPHDLFRGRVMFPIKDERGRTIGFGGRILPRLAEKAGGKYLNTPSTDLYNKSKVLYGIHVATEAVQRQKKSEPRRIVVMEGYTDCLMAWQAGMLTAVATCGTALTPQHVGRLGQLADRVILMFDGDAAGQKAAREATGLMLAASADIRLCTLPDGQDPADFVKANGLGPLLTVIESAPDALAWLIGRARAFAGDSLEQKRRAVDVILDLLAKTPVSPDRAQAVKFDLALSELTKFSGVAEESLRARVREIRSGPAANRAQPKRPDAAAPMEARERWIAQWMVCRPAHAGDLLELFPADQFRNPVLRRLAEACAAVHLDLEERATADDLRATLDDPALDGQVVEFLATEPDDESYRRGLADIRDELLRQGRRLTRGGALLADGAATSDHLDLLRRARELHRNRSGD
jgi:DNA primase